MCLSGPVGRGAKNAQEDVRTVQLLLNLNSPQVTGPLTADGICGPGTIAAIELYQHGVVGHADPAGVVGVNGSTLAALRAGMPPGMLREKFQGVMIHAPSATVERFLMPVIASMHVGGIDTPLRQAHFLAQVAHESGELRYTEELASGEQYEGRKDLGNTQKGDGVRFKGRGLIQLTGRANYIAFGKFANADFTVGDAMARISTEPMLAVQTAVWFWNQHELNALADTDDLVAITKKINGGTNGLADRRSKLERAKFFLVPLTTDIERAATKAAAFAENS
ncbi:MAG: chitinase [Acidobacteria bacterium]|nr:chitinase [Acidobacteriota bacterium]